MNQKLKKIMILSGTYIVLMTVLLIGVSTAKYTESTVAYSSFGAASYNVILLGTDETTGASQQFGKTLLSSDLVPGMKYTGVSATNTAKMFPFKVANGTTQNDVSEIALDYTVKLRTTRNLPLGYKMMLGGTVFTATGPVPLDKNGRRVTSGTPELDDNGIAWYEWTFKDIGNTGSGTVETAAEPVFSLAAGQVISNDHTLVVEWPVTVGENGMPNGNSDEYMKEIELLEVRIVSAQQNNATEMPAGTVQNLDVRQYSKGFIVLDPEQDVQTYEVDYRAFRRNAGDANSYSYEFTVDNGVSIGVNQTDDTTRYKITVNAPMMWQGEEGTGSMNYAYGLAEEIRTEQEPDGTGEYEDIPWLGERYFTVNLEDGSRTEVGYDYDYREELVNSSADGSTVRFYKEIRYMTEDAGTADEDAVFEIANTEIQGEVTVPVSGSNSFLLTLANTGGSAIPAYLQLNGTIQIVIEKVE